MSPKNAYLAHWGSLGLEVVKRSDDTWESYEARRAFWKQDYATAEKSLSRYFDSLDAKIVDDGGPIAERLECMLARAELARLRNQNGKAQKLYREVIAEGMRRYGVHSPVTERGLLGLRESFLRVDDFEQSEDVNRLLADWKSQFQDPTVLRRDFDAILEKTAPRDSSTSIEEIKIKKLLDRSVPDMVAQYEELRRRIRL